MAMGQNPNRTPVKIPIPTKIGSKMGASPPQHSTIGFDPQPNGASLTRLLPKACTLGGLDWSGIRSVTWQFAEKIQKEQD